MPDRQTLAAVVAIRCSRLVNSQKQLARQLQLSLQEQ